MLPGSSSTTAWTCSSCCSAMAWRMACGEGLQVHATRLDGPRGRPPAPRPAAPRPPRSTAKAAPQPGRSAGWLLLDRPLDVLRVVVAAADDDEVLEPAGDEQLAVVRGSRGRRCAGSGAVAARRPARRRKVLRRLLRAVPVALGDAGPATPRSRRPRPAAHAAPRLGVDDDELAGPASVAAAADQRPRVRRPVGRHVARPVARQRGACRRCAATGALALRAAGDDQRGLGQAVAGVERLAAEAARREGLGEALAASRRGPARRR